MGLQFESRRLRARVPGIVWLGVTVVLALTVVYLARQVILPFVLALFLTYLLLPLVAAPFWVPRSSG